MTQDLYPSLPILLVDDEISILRACEVSLSLQGINHTIRCQDSRKIMEMLQLQDMDLILLDLNMPHISGEELLVEITEKYPDLPVVIITGNDDIDSAISCIKKGAYDYLVKPISRERLLTVITHIIDMRKLQRENAALKDRGFTTQLTNPACFAEIITGHQLMLSTFAYIEAIAPTPQPVLITGETGTGKELIARAIHKASGREGKFVAVNVAGLDDNVFSDTLFGHKKGAFTGADSSRPGLIETAHGGTLFLDEIGDLNATCQVKLLRLLQEHEYLPLGSDTPIRTDTRIVVSTHANLHALREKNLFRSDLFFRLTTHQIQLPTLRQRLEDLPLLIAHFLEKSSQTLGRKKPTPPEELPSLLSTYHFPGNIRELESMIFDAVSRHQSGILSLSVFREYIRNNRNNSHTENRQLTNADSATPFLLSFAGRFPTLKQADRFLMDEAMKCAQGNQSQAAALLGISRPALNKRLKNIARQ